ncbi:hypothetical protein F2P81_003886 [Scophthalmus maximus]|uniref:Transposase element L1Md-A101/L1Md-A102/L1Md-A2 n=1 Tax=Scophthalmus maximus TaxID=52904 RepID=A0A6A4TJT9_SCOMX|nr:hypothetical protein F2P81_003886 [Scophthalmus maximus]
MPPNTTKQQSGKTTTRGNSNSSASLSAEKGANANSMDALANAVTAVQASINSFREENRASIASLHLILSVYGQRITDMEDGLNEFDKRLSSVEASQTSLAKENDALREKVAYLENYTRRQNIRIVGISQNTEGPRRTEFITKLLINVLGEDSFEKPPSVDRAHRSLAPKPADGNNRPRPFIVKLHHFQTKELILRLARQKGPLSFNGSRFHNFPDCSPDVNKQRTGFSESKKKLHATKIQFGLYYPATLQFTHNGKRMKFTDPAEALTYIDNNVIDNNGHPAPHAAENGD